MRLNHITNYMHYHMVVVDGLCSLSHYLGDSGGVFWRSGAPALLFFPDFQVGWFGKLHTIATVLWDRVVEGGREEEKDM